MASQKKKAHTTSPDRGFTLSKKQYDIIFSYLKDGVAPIPRDIKAAEFDRSLSVGQPTITTSRKMGTFSRFKSVAKRLKYRTSDDTLIFYVNSKIVLPNNQFVQAITNAHQSNGVKHYNFTKTLEKLSEKYSIGRRQFGISEELVREVVRECQEGSCAKHHRTKSGSTQPALCPKSNTKNFAAPLDSTTTVSSSMGSSATATTGQSQPRPQMLLQCQPGPNYLAVPCMFHIPASMTPGSIPGKPFLLYTGSCNAQNPGKSTSVTMTTRTGPSGNVNRFMLMPTPSLATPNLLQLLTVNPAKMQESMKITIPPLLNMSALTNQTSHVQGQNSASETPGNSNSLTNISQTVGTINLQGSTTLAVDHNNNLIQVKDDDQVMAEPLVDGRNSKSDKRKSQDPVSEVYRDVMQTLEVDGSGEHSSDLILSEMTSGNCAQPALEPIAFPHSHIWHNLPELSKEQEPYRRIIGGIQDMRPDVLKALAWGTHAADHLKKKITFVEHMIKSLKQFTGDFDTFSDAEEETSL